MSMHPYAICPIQGTPKPCLLDAKSNFTYSSQGKVVRLYFQVNRAIECPVLGIVSNSSKNLFSYCARILLINYSKLSLFDKNCIKDGYQ